MFTNIKREKIKDEVGNMINLIYYEFENTEGEDYKDHVIEADDNICEKFGFTSLEIINVIIGIEDRYNIKVDEDDLILENFDTINKIIEYVCKKINENE